MIMRTVNVGIPLLSLITVVALAFRHLILVQPSLRSVGLAQFLSEKLYGHQCGNNTDTDHGGRANLFAG
jgi:hypothetical protein